MKLFTSLAVAGFALSAVTALTAAPVPAMAANPITIQQCFVTPPRPLSKRASGTQIDFVNRGAKVATSITFAVGYRNSANHYLRRVTDVGTFSPGAVVKNHFQLFNDITYAGKQTSGCNAVSVHWADGTRWAM